MRIKAILFDLDGVILDTEKIYQKYWVQAASELGFQLDETVFLQLRSCDSSLARGILDRAAGEEGAYDRIRARRKKLTGDFLRENEIELKEGVVDFLSEIKDLPVKKAIVTSSSAEEKLPSLKKQGIAEYFDEIVSVKNALRGKPFPDLYLCACGKLGLAPEECLAVEDSPNGVISAYKAGIPVVMVPDLTEPDAELAGMCTVVRRIGDILNLDFWGR